MTGDSAGVRVEGQWRPRPAVPPPDLDLELLFSSLDRMEALGPRAIHFTHFGVSPEGPADLERYRGAVEEWRDIALSAALVDPSISHIATALQAHEEAAGGSGGGGPRNEERGLLVSGYDLAAQGLLRYFRSHGQVPA